MKAQTKNLEIIRDLFKTAWECYATACEPFKDMFYSDIMELERVFADRLDEIYF
ncbi:hypothetical protein LJC68_10060 [Bacteroidales bacterium OttesenSCG-928-B11]|nr:hypothetical protein [Bacteroidales bacterium OttesenSCG-928-C03]MDL2313204.1 hypothetical protein [Bacteroidales bacterium OttesenSCG-928-B11]MDL2326128.1 hypothetical protein [Bacteroidales bacterium OttesenSCG-928-A14]